MRSLLAIRLAVFTVVFLELSVGLRSTLFAQEWFKPQLSPTDWASPDLLKPRLKALAGPKALNCGLTSSKVKAADISDCALQAYASRKSFFARYDLQCFDFSCARGFAFDGQKLYSVTWAKPLIGWGDRQALDVEDCPLPVTLTKTKTGYLKCFPSDPLADH